MSGGRADFDVVFDLGNPFNAVERHAIFMLQNAAHPQHRGRHHRLHADLATAQVGGLADAFRRVDEHEAMPETAMQENRDRAERQVVITRSEIR